MTQSINSSHVGDPVDHDVKLATDRCSTVGDAGELAVQHLELVTYWVHSTMARVPSHVDRDDLRSAGLMALVKASQSYRPDRGASFATYATTRIRGALLDELRSVDWASRSVRRKAREIEEARGRLATVLGHFPDDAAVAAALAIESDELARTVHDVSRARVVSLDEQRDNAHRDTIASNIASNVSTMGEVMSAELGPEARLELAERLEYLQAAIAELPDRLRAVVEGYFLDERPMAAIAAELGVTESRISQMRAEALVMLREGLNACLDPDLVKPAPASQGRPNGAATRRLRLRHRGRRPPTRHTPALWAPIPGRGVTHSRRLNQTLSRAMDTNALSTTGLSSATHISGEVDELRRRTRHLTARSRHLVVQTQNAMSRLHPATEQADIIRALRAARIPRRDSLPTTN